MSAIECRELFRVHRTREGDAAALQGLNLTLQEGEALACLGPSGSGKSTLLRVLAGLETPSAGSAAVFGIDLGRCSPRRRARVRQELIGLIDQHPERTLPPDLAIRDAVALPLTLRGGSARSARRTAESHLELLGLGERTGARAAELSGGERQRVAICTAIVHRPRLLLADEPTGELDAASAREILALLVQLSRDQGSSLLLVTHDPAAAAFADRSVDLRDGRISEETRDGRSAAVVSQGGWLRIPAPLLERAGIVDRALLHADERGITLEPVAPRSAAAEARPLPPAPEQVVGVSAHAIRRAHGPRRVLDDLHADWPPATFTAIIGPSGSGKSTLLRILAGLEEPDAGRVLIDGIEVGALDRQHRADLRASRIAYVSQGDVLLGHLSALEQTGVETADATMWLTLLGLGHRLDQRTERLSGGERQRAAIARALASGRGVVILDEPTSRLDVLNAETLGETLASVAHQHRRTIICATHDPVLIARADRTLDLSAGGRSSAAAQTAPGPPESPLSA